MGTITGTADTWGSTGDGTATRTSEDEAKQWLTDFERADITTLTLGAAAASALVPLAETLQACLHANQLRMDQVAPLMPELRSMLFAWSQFVGGFDGEVLYSARIFWSRVHGLVSLEIGQQFPSYISDPGEVFHREMANLLIQYLAE